MSITLTDGDVKSSCSRVSSLKNHLCLLTTTGQNVPVTLYALCGVKKKSRRDISRLLCGERTYGVPVKLCPIASGPSLTDRSAGLIDTSNLYAVIR